MDFLIVTKAPGAARLRVHCTRIVEVQTRHTFARWFYGAADRIRTGDVQLGKVPEQDLP